jgi:hypothetical protein
LNQPARVTRPRSASAFFSSGFTTAHVAASHRVPMIDRISQIAHCPAEGFELRFMLVGSRSRIEVRDAIGFRRLRIGRGGPGGLEDKQAEERERTGQ